MCFKLFIETKQWNLISVGAGILSIGIYYIVLALGGSPTIANIFQPEINGILP